MPSAADLSRRIAAGPGCDCRHDCLIRPSAPGSCRLLHGSQDGIHAAMLDQPSLNLPQSGTGRPVSGMVAGFVAMLGPEKAALIAAWLLLGLSAMALRLVAFRRLAPILGTPIGPVACVPLIDGKQEERARLVKRAVRRAARIAPLRSDCLPQVLAGSLLCRLLAIPTTAYLGVRLGSNPNISAHAWLCAGPVPVTGGSSFEEFTVVIGFAEPQLARAAGLHVRLHGAP